MTASLIFVSGGHEAPPRRPDADVSPEQRPPNLRGVLAGIGGVVLAARRRGGSAPAAGGPAPEAVPSSSGNHRTEGE